MSRSVYQSVILTQTPQSKSVNAKSGKYNISELTEELNISLQGPPKSLILCEPRCLNDYYLFRFIQILGSKKPMHRLGLAVFTAPVKKVLIATFSNMIQQYLRYTSE